MNPVRPDATIIIPQFDSAELTCACIESLRQVEPVAWPIVVVDDGSSPASRREVAARRFAGTQVVRQSHTGVSAAWNRGAAVARTRFVVFLNNDVLVRGPSIDRLVEPLRRGTAILSGVRSRREAALPPEVLRRLPTDRFVEGWCFATPLDLFRRLGGFDETMRVYWSDTDFQARLVAVSGESERSIAVADVPLKHLGHRTAHRLRERKRIWQDDRAAFIAKWSSGWQSAFSGQRPVHERCDWNQAEC